MSKLRISIITPFYNSSETLKKTLDSIQKINSTLFYEWIIVDDHSTNDHKEFLSKIETNYNFIRVIYLNNNNGPSAARNIGIQQSNANYHLFIDADITISVEDFELILNKIHKQPDLIFTTGQHEIPNSNFPTFYKANYMNCLFNDYKQGERVFFIYGSLCGFPNTEKFRWPEQLRYGEDTYLAQDIIRSKQDIIFDKVKLIHTKEYSYTSLLINDFKIPYHFSESYLKHRSLKKSHQRFSHVKTWQLVAISLCPLILMESVLKYNKVLLVTITLWLIANYKLLHEEIKNVKNIFLKPIYLTGVIIFTYIDQWFMGLGIFTGLCNNITKKIKE